tara:strand:+ start:1807 stop:2232 length:426 start_codon:yes stop_codon:yes gene_type:complete
VSIQLLKQQDVIWNMNYIRKVMFLLVYLFFLKTGFCEWVQISKSEKGAYYVDPGSVLLIDEEVKSVWVLINLKQTEDKVKSRQLKLEMDCLSEEIRIKSLYSYSGFFLGGIPIKNYYKTEEWRSIETDTDLKVVYTRFCDK